MPRAILHKNIFYRHKKYKKCNTLTIKTMERGCCMKKDIRILLFVCAALGWWGFLYPELTMTPDTYRVVEEDGTVRTEGEGIGSSDSGIYWEVLSADSSQIRFRSKLLDSLTAFAEYRRTGHESGE